MSQHAASFHLAMRDQFVAPLRDYLNTPLSLLFDQVSVGEPLLRKDWNEQLHLFDVTQYVVWPEDDWEDEYDC